MDGLQPETQAPGQVDVTLLIARGFLPKANGLHPVSGAPCWTFNGLAQMFELSAVELARELVRRGPVHEE